MTRHYGRGEGGIRVYDDRPGNKGQNITGVAELRYDTGKNTRGNPKMIFEILMGDWNISKF